MDLSTTKELDHVEGEGHSGHPSIPICEGEVDLFRSLAEED